MTSDPPTTCPDCASPTLGTDQPGVRFCYRCQRQITVQVDNAPPNPADRPQKGTGRGRGAGATVDGRAQYRTRNKYGAKRTEVDGIMFHSAAEARRYKALVLMEAAGEISGLMLQPSFDLTVNGSLVCRYRADFEYTESGARVIEDVKGKVTAGHVIKRKLMLACHGIAIRETK